MAGRDENTDQKRYETLALLVSDRKLSGKKISKLTGLGRVYISIIRRKYLLAKLLGVNVKEIADNVLLSYISIAIPIETYFCYCIVQCLIETKKVEQVKIFLVHSGDLCKLMNIQVEEIEELDEDSIINGIEIVKKQLK